MICYGSYPCPLGTLIIGWEHNSVVSLKLAEGSTIDHAPSPVSDLAAFQIQEYLAGRQKEFDFAIAPSGTPFQTTVWKALMQIPYGETRTYGQIAAMIGNPRAARAVGLACNKNPLWIVVPCHRVVGKGQSLTGYAGGLPLKQALLDLEQRNS